MITRRSAIENLEFVLRILLYPSRYRIVQVGLQNLHSTRGNGIGVNPSIAMGFVGLEAHFLHTGLCPVDDGQELSFEYDTP